MTDWNPVEGLQKIEPRDVKAGDHIRTSNNNLDFLVVTDFKVNRVAPLCSLTHRPLYYEITTLGGEHTGAYDDDETNWYLVSRNVEEPKGLGAVVEIEVSTGAGIVKNRYLRALDKDGKYAWQWVYPSGGDGQTHRTVQMWSWEELIEYCETPYLEILTEGIK